MQAQPPCTEFEEGTSLPGGAADGGFDTVGAPFVTHDVDPTGATCGGQIGYNLQTGGFVFGVEADLAWLDLDREERGTGPDADPANLDDLVAVRYDWYGTLTGRLGIAFNQVLLYAKGGVAFTRVPNTASDLDALAIDPTDFVEDRRRRAG